jgi:hypothetical protein
MHHITSRGQHHQHVTQAQPMVFGLALSLDEKLEDVLQLY